MTRRLALSFSLSLVGSRHKDIHTTVTRSMKEKKDMPSSPKQKDKTKPAKSGPKTTTKRGEGTGLNDVFIGIFAVAFVLSLTLNVLHTTGSIEHSYDSPLHQAMQEFKQTPRKKKIKLHDKNPIMIPKSPQQQAAVEEEETEPEHNEEHPHELHLGSDKNLAELNCQAFGGPSNDAAQEMVYWQDIPSDALYRSPFQHPGETKYLTFEPDGGGWNNIRMAMESVIGLSIAMGRTLVMPPQKKMYLLGKGDNKQRKHFSFVDFFPIEEMASEHVGLDVISMKEYLEKEAMTGKLRNRETGKVEYPPGNRTDWDNIDQADYDLLRGYLRNVTECPQWKPGQCLPAFPSSGNHKDIELLQQLVPKARHFRSLPDDQPFTVDDPNPLPRLEETLNGRKELCIYDEALQAEPALHFQCNHKLHLRLLVHFYGFLYFEDWKEDLWMKRFIRDHVRYIDEIQCAAARVVAGVRAHARNRDPSNNPNGIFDSFHIRRGDFQFKDTRISAEQILENSKDELTPKSTIFVATDERKKDFFKPLRQDYDLLFLDDFKEELKGVNTNYYGMIDQLVASRGNVFFGCFHSTFTGYINRIRGYHSVKDEAPGYEKGALPTTYYYSNLDKKFIMQKYSPLKGAFFNRENPISWRDLNKGIGMLNS